MEDPDVAIVIVGEADFAASLREDPTFESIRRMIVLHDKPIGIHHPGGNTSFLLPESWTNEYSRGYIGAHAETIQKLLGPEALAGL